MHLCQFRFLGELECEILTLASFRVNARAVRKSAVADIFVLLFVGYQEQREWENTIAESTRTEQGVNVRGKHQYSCIWSSGDCLGKPAEALPRLQTCTR